MSFQCLNTEHLNKVLGGDTFLWWTHLPWKLDHEQNLYFPCPKKKKKKNTFVHYWPGQDLDQQYQGRSTSLKDSLFPFSLVHSWLKTRKTRRKQPAVSLGSWAKSIWVNENISYWCHSLQNVLPVSHYDICVDHSLLDIIPCSLYLQME